MKSFFNDKSLFSSAFFGVFLLVFVLLLSLRCVREIECVDENDDDGVTRKMNADSDEAFRRKKNRKRPVRGRGGIRGRGGRGRKNEKKQEQRRKRIRMNLPN